MSHAAPSGGSAGTVPVRSPSWPVRSGTVPAIADGYIDRIETAPDLTAALRPGTMVALVSRRAADPGPSAGSTARDWLRSSGKTQLAVALAESLWHSRELDLLVWIDASSRASVLSGYAAATALVTGREQATSCESVAAQFLSWLAETSHPWLIVLDDLTDDADMDGLCPAGPAGRTLVTCADAAAVPRGMRVVPIGPFNSREALSYLTERLSANRGQRLGAIDLVNAMGVEPAALAQASAVIASSAMSCQSYQDYFVRWREYLASSADALPLASAVTWPVSLESATAFAPGASVRSLLAVAALLDGHGIPATVLTAPATVRYLNGGETAEDAEPALAALAALERVGLRDRAATRVDKMSHGEQRQLEIAMALAGSPQLLLLDEPMAGMGPDESSRMVQLLRALKGSVTILLIEHDMEAVFALADRLSVLVYGRIIATGSPETIRNDPAVRQAYLGEKHGAEPGARNG